MYIVGYVLFCNSLKNNMIEGKTLWVDAPSVLGFLSAFFRGAVWTIKFKCGNCGAEPTVQHDSDKNYHKCPVCKQVNILDIVDHPLH
jgi:hypothetical protein